MTQPFLIVITNVGTASFNNPKATTELKPALCSVVVISSSAFHAFLKTIAHSFENNTAINNGLFFNIFSNLMLL
ncbi:MAG: hypothetical protein COB77_06630 [Gammaproteobacteria bacterium]|nr:MAG: hypothetical protein COB77_06630 [Gammaproteobacteria bacterium]